MFEDAPEEKAAQSFKIVDDMLNGLFSINATMSTPRDMLERSWNDDMIWYGPCGIGASYTIPPISGATPDSVPHPIDG